MKVATLNDGNGHSNPRSCLVVGELARRGHNVIIFENRAEMENLDSDTVIFFDWNRRVNNFSPVLIVPHMAPDWATGGARGVQIGSACVKSIARISRAAEQIEKMFDHSSEGVPFKRPPKGPPTGKKRQKKGDSDSPRSFAQVGW